MSRPALCAFATALLAVWGTHAAADGGPDDFGYTWTDSLTGSATYAWVDVREDPDAEELILGDEGSAAIDIGFPFTFYAAIHDRVQVHANGFLSFADVGQELAELSSLCAVPRAGDIDGAIFLYARDWNPGQGGTVHALATGTAPNRVLIVQFTGVPLFADESGLVDVMTVQALLHEGTNDIDVQVQETDDSAGGNGMVGLESPDGLSGLAYQGCQQDGSLPAETAIHFAYPSSELAVVPHRLEHVDRPDRGVNHWFAVYNRGPSEVTVPIAVTSAWPATTTPDGEITVAAGEEGALLLTVSIPIDAAPGDTCTTVVDLAGPEGIELTAMTGVQRPNQGDFQRVADLPRANDDLVAGLTDDAVWTAGGRTLAGVDYVVSDSLARYDIATNTWTTSEDGAFTPLPEGRFLAAGCALDGHLYVIGGFTAAVDEVTHQYQIGDTALDYDIAGDVWGDRAALPEPRAGAAAVCDEAGGRVFLFGGYTNGAGDGLEDVLDVLVYEPVADAWAAAGTLTASRTSGAVAQIDAGTIVLAGGFYDGHASASVEAYDVLAGTFTSLPSLPDARTFAVAGAFDGEMCVASGHAAGADRTDWFCLAPDMWIVQKDALPTPVRPASGGVADGRLYVVGGQDALGDATNAVQRWPPAPLADGDADSDADSDADADGDADGDGGADGDSDADGGTGGGHGDCCTVAPGAPGQDHSGLLVLAALLVGAALLRRRAGSQA